MTQAEKAKAYDEAIERARKYMAKGYDVLMTDIFPELKESEDEMIRKEIITALKFANDDGVYDKHIAWLEKQKEKNQIISNRELTDFEIEVHEIIAQARTDKRLDDTNVLKQFEQEAAYALMLKAEKKQEHKPAEWSDEDDKIRRNLMSLLACMRGNKIKEETYQKYYPWLKSLPN